jgi:uncharacterized protein (TIGR02145 family)
MKYLSILIAVSIAVIISLTTVSCNKHETETSLIDVTEDTPVTDYDGNTYKTIKIGNQVWMAENLRSTHYSDGSPITIFNYDNDDANVLVFGRLYTWSAVMMGATSSNSNPSNVQGIAPVGWHVPSKAEWQQLIDYLGGVSVAGGKMKEQGIAHWTNPNEGATNESRFTALPSGMFAFWQEFQWKGDYSTFATTSDASAPGHPAVTTARLQYDNTQATIGDFHPDDAVSVRCLKD